MKRTTAVECALHQSIGSAMVRRILAHYSARPDAVIVNSLDGERFHQGLGYRARRWVHLPNGFDTAALHPDPEARRRHRVALGLGKDAVAILLPARYHPMKDHASFLTAAAQLAAAQPQAGGLHPGRCRDRGGQPGADRGHRAASTGRARSALGRALGHCRALCGSRYRHAVVGFRRRLSERDRRGDVLRHAVRRHRCRRRTIDQARPVASSRRVTRPRSPRPGSG